jgi:Mrp family chromosome partitioning ATPase
MALNSIGKTETQKLSGQVKAIKAARNEASAPIKWRPRWAAAEAEANDLALIREIDDEIDTEVPHFKDVTKAIRHFAGRYLRDEKPHQALIGVLSAKSGEGRTTVALALAAALAEMYRRVVLVELEIERATPPLWMEMHLGEKRGLRDYLDQEGLPGSIVWPTSHANLWLLPIGPPPAESSHLDATGKTKELFAKLSNAFDVVVVDLPPGLTSEDAPVLLAGLTGVVLIASAGSTTTEDVKQTLRLVGSAPIKGILLNQVRLRAPRWLASLLRS